MPLLASAAGLCDRARANGQSAKWKGRMRSCHGRSVRCASRLREDAQPDRPPARPPDQPTKGAFSSTGDERNGEARSSASTWGRVRRTARTGGVRLLRSRGREARARGQWRDARCPGTARRHGVRRGSSSGCEGGRLRQRTDLSPKATKGTEAGGGGPTSTAPDGASYTAMSASWPAASATSLSARARASSRCEAVRAVSSARSLERERRRVGRTPPPPLPPGGDARGYAS